MAVASSFRLREAEALAILAAVEAARSNWRQAAAAAGLAGGEATRMSPAFEHGQAETGRLIRAAT